MRGKLDGKYSVRMTRELSPVASPHFVRKRLRGLVINTNCVILAARGKARAVGGIVQTKNLIVLFLDGMKRFAAGDVPVVDLAAGVA